MLSYLRAPDWLLHVQLLQAKPENKATGHGTKGDIWLLPSYSFVQNPLLFPYSKKNLMTFLAHVRFV